MHLLASGTGTTSLIGLLLAVFGASTVEMVEALTIVVAVGATIGWRTSLRGAGAAVGVLCVLVAAGGVPLVRYTPINALRVIVGAMLLLLGLAWLRKAVLRAAGIIAVHDEDRIYEETVASLRGSDDGAARREGFSVAFKGVFLEGIEVVLIVISLGASQHRLADAAAAAGAALVLVAAVGAIVAKQLASVPENALKLTVGIMLTSFGTFWIGEGAGVHWPGSDVMLLVLVALFAATAALLTVLARRTPARVASGR